MLVIGPDQRLPGFGTLDDPGELIGALLSSARRRECLALFVYLLAAGVLVVFIDEAVHGGGRHALARFIWMSWHGIHPLSEWWLELFVGRS
jgi:hypothetical protein